MPKNYKAKETVLVITVGLLALHLLLKRNIFLYLSLGVGLSGVFSFYLSERIDWFWGKLSHILGEVTNGILLSIVFFFVVTPVGWIRRLGKKGGLGYFDKSATSNFSDRDGDIEKKDFEKTW